MAHTEFAAEMSPLASEPRLRCASENSTKRTTDAAASETAHHASLDSRSLNDHIARPFCKQRSAVRRALAHLSTQKETSARNDAVATKAK